MLKEINLYLNKILNSKILNLNIIIVIFISALLLTTHSSFGSDAPHAICNNKLQVILDKIIKENSFKEKISPSQTIFDSPTGGVTVKLKESGLAVISINTPNEGHNLITHAFGKAFAEALRVIDSNKAKSVIIITEKENFSAGVNLNLILNFNKESDAFDSSRNLQLLFQKLNEVKVPVHVAVKGNCIGGGLEMALAADWIIAAESKTRFWLPEVKQGFVPGGGGLVRLPMRVGVSESVNMIIKGRPVNSKKALNIGLADIIIPSQDFNRRAIEIAENSIQSKLTKNHETYKTRFNLENEIIKLREIKENQKDKLTPLQLKVLQLIESNTTNGLENISEMLLDEALLFGSTASRSQTREKVKRTLKIK